jgi:hypothetical protein
MRGSRRSAATALIVRFRLLQVLEVRHDHAVHHPAVVTLLTGAIQLLSVVAGIVGALVWRRRAIQRGRRVTPLWSMVAVFNGAALGIVAGATIYLLVAVSLPAPA